MELDDLLDELPHGLARKVAAALAPDTESEEEEDDFDIPFTIDHLVPEVEPCPVTFTEKELDTYLPTRATLTARARTTPTREADRPRD